MNSIKPINLYHYINILFKGEEWWNIMNSNDKISIISKCISGEILPNHSSTKAQFYQDISSEYEGEAIAYLLQEVGKAFYHIILSVIGAFLYDYIKKKIDDHTLKNKINSYYDNNITLQLRDIRSKIEKADKEKRNIPFRHRKYVSKILDDYRDSIDELENRKKSVDRLTNLLIKYSSLNDKELEKELKKHDKSIEALEEYMKNNIDKFIRINPKK